MRSAEHRHQASAGLALAFLVTAVLSAGCVPQRMMDRPTIVRDPELLDASGMSPDLSSPFSSERRAVQIQLAFLAKDARGAMLVESVDPARLAEQHCREWFVRSKNYVVVNRDHMEQVHNEATRAGAATIVPADYLVSLTVGMVERELRSDGTTGEWSVFGIGTGDTDRQRQGAVEVQAEIIYCPNQTMVHSVRGVGILDEIERSKSGQWFVGGGSVSTRTRTSVSDAIRAATREIAKEADRYFGEVIEDRLVELRAARGSREGGTQRSQGPEAER